MGKQNEGERQFDKVIGTKKMNLTKDEMKDELKLRCVKKQKEIKNKNYAKQIVSVC